MYKNISLIRDTFLNFFKKYDHKIIESSSLIPNNDSSILFTNAGMNQFKNIFLGKENYKHKRVVTAQRCIRVGGKHNDFENVGYTTKHHTFFEMLGNFSFNDYFKEEAIYFAWKLLTSKDWFNISKNKLLVTVYYQDNESFNIWKKIGIPENKIIKIGNKNKPYDSNNFWQMSDTGPCGPCTEIFYDYKYNINKNNYSKVYNLNKDCYIEIWNIVFIQFNKNFDGKLLKLNKPSVDTGMGLERITSILQNVKSNYEIDLFYKLIKEISQLIDVKFDLNNPSLRIIADHIRSTVFLIYDGVLPDNVNRGYVLRRIIRRAIRHGYILGIKNIFFYKLVSVLINVIKDKYTEKIYAKKEFIEKIIFSEEKQFQKTLNNGLHILNKEIKNIKNNILDGNTIFRLHDTFGMPIDLIEDVCREKNLVIDKLNFEHAMNNQKIKSKRNNLFDIQNNIINVHYTTEFVGYNKLKTKAQVKYIFDSNNIAKNNIKINTNGIIILDKTSFYYESGGQVGDIGLLIFKKNKFLVKETKKNNNLICHIGTVISGEININDNIISIVDENYRMQISQNHSATHILNKALRIVLDEKIAQKGSYINDKYIRLDFSYFNNITEQQIIEIEKIVNKQIRNNLMIKSFFTSFESAKEKKIKYLKSEKYDNKVRVIDICNFSKELCCGTHVKRTGNIGLFKIIKVTGISFGIKRIECITGETALIHFQNQYEQTKKISSLLKIEDFNLYKKINNLTNYVKDIESKYKIFKNKYVIQKTDSLINKMLQINNVNILVAKISNFDYQMLRFSVNYLKTKLKNSVIVLVTINFKKIFLVTGVTKKLTHLLTANNLLKMIISRIKGKGGGNFYLAQGIGIDIMSLDKSLNDIKSFIKNTLQNKF